MKLDNTKQSDFTFIKSDFLNSGYLHYIIPGIYISAMLVLIFTNRAIGDYGVESDFYSGYVPQAKEFLKGNLIIDPYKGPLYQIILAIFGFVFQNDFFLAGKFINVISAGLSLFMISRIIGSLLNREGAFFATLIIAVNLTFLRYTYETGTDMLFLVFYSSALFYILKNSFPESNNYFIAGLFSSLAYLTRYTGLSLIILLVFIFLLNILKTFFQNKSNQLTFNFKPFIYFFIPVIIFISVWGIISVQKTGSFFYNMNYLNTAFTVYKPEDVSKDEWNLKFQNEFRSMSDVVLKDFSVFSKTIFVKNFPLYLKKDLTRLLPKYFGVFVILGIIFFIFYFRKTKLLQKYFLLSGLLLYLQMLLIFYAERFSIPLLPVYSFLIVWFFDQELLRRFNLKIGGIKLFALILISLISINLYSSVKYVTKEINSGPNEILVIRDWVKANDKLELKGKKIMARKPHIAYYLDMDFQSTTFSENYNSYVSNLRSANADYLYISEKEADYITDDNLRQMLLNFQSPPPDLEVITNTTEPVGILYKLKK